VWDIACVQVPRLLKTASFRLTALYSAVFMMSFALLLLLTFIILTAALREQIKVKVMGDLDDMTSEWREDGLPAISSDIAQRTGNSLKSGAFYYLEDATGKKLAGNLANAPRIAGWQEAPLQTRLAETAVIDPDEDHQLWGQGVILPDQSFLFAGEDAFRVISAQETIVDTFLWSAALALLLATGVGIVVSQGFLRRIDAINRTSLSIMDGTLKARIPVAGTSDEIDRLSLNLNRLFDSNQTLLESLKQVTTNIAHDLRTPLSRLRQSLEVARAGKPSVKHYGQTIDGAIAESDQLLATFAALLRIAQIESGSRRSAFRNFDLSETVSRLVNAYQPAAEDQGKNLLSDISESIFVLGDSELITQALSNLLENALRHSGPASHIVVGLAGPLGRPVITVADNGQGIPPELRTRVFERFFRLEDSRTTPGNGLGLTLVAAVAELHNIQIDLEDNNPGLKVLLQFHVP
jgi:signal transduction histidine kinase